MHPQAVRSHIFQPAFAEPIDAFKHDHVGAQACPRSDHDLSTLRIETDDELVLTRESIEFALGRPFSMNDLEVELASFAGRIDTGSDRVRFYYETRL